MNDDACTRLEQRIARLELANRRWRRFAACSRRSASHAWG